MGSGRTSLSTRSCPFISADGSLPCLRVGQSIDVVNIPGVVRCRFVCFIFLSNWKGVLWFGESGMYKLAEVSMIDLYIQYIF